MKHSHFNPGLLTFGCAACIERVRRDQVRAVAREVADHIDGYMGWPSIPCEAQLAQIQQTVELCSLVTKLLADEGWDDDDIDDAYEYWDRCLRDREAIA